MNKLPNDTELLSRISWLEMKVNVLLGLVGIQVVMLLVSWITGLFGSTFWILTMLIVLGGLVYALRQKIPAWSGMLIRQFFSRGTDGKSEDRIV